MAGEDKRAIAYVCPACRQTVMAERTIFQLAATSNRIPCPCGKSAVEIEMMGDRAELQIPCLLCGKEHIASCRTQDLLHRKCMAFSCAQSGLNCCFIGEEEEVEKAARRLEETLDKLPQEGEEQGVFLDPVIMEQVLDEIKDIAERDGISCTCGSHQWNMKVHYSIVELICSRCGGKLRLGAATEDDLTDLCCCYTLQIRGEDPDPEKSERLRS